MTIKSGFLQFQWMRSTKRCGIFVPEMNTEKESDLTKTRKAGGLVKKGAATDQGWPDIVEAVDEAYPIPQNGMRGIVVPLRNRIRQLEQELEECRKKQKWLKNLRKLMNVSKH